MPEPTRPAETYTISELAREFDVTPRAIRFYEHEGLLSPQRVGQNRVYDKRDYVRLKLTLRGKRLGFSLSEVREMMDVYDAARDEKAQLAKFVDKLSERRAQLERQRADIDEMLTEIIAFEAQSRRLLAANGSRRAAATGKRKPARKPARARARSG